jgi:hypothetical protein
MKKTALVYSGAVYFVAVDPAPNGVADVAYGVALRPPDSCQCEKKIGRDSFRRHVLVRLQERTL